MDRRGFLRGILAAGVAPAIVQVANLMPVFVRRESGLLAPRFMGDLVRSTFAYDILRNEVEARFDILFGWTQLCVAQRFPNMDAARTMGAKGIAVELFDKELRHQGLSWADVRPLPPFPLPLAVA